jgi:hypothetical protein
MVASGVAWRGGFDEGNHLDLSRRGLPELFMKAKPRAKICCIASLGEAQAAIAGRLDVAKLDAFFSAIP